MTEPDKLSLFFSAEFPFNKEGLQDFIGTFKTKKYEKNDLVINTGETETELRFLDKGTVREFYAVGDEEKNINFYIDTEFITDFYSFTNATCTKKYQECLTNVELRVLSKQSFLDFTNKFDCGRLFIETVFQRLVAKKEQDEFNHFVHTAEELYLDIMKNKPEWLRQIPQYHIASYLGIKPETLSRIRKRM
jgi:signal-transduction protein with cAMP-binding, CBS, and nucleotidyltransferase domain